MFTCAGTRNVTPKHATPRRLFLEDSDASMKVIQKPIRELQLDCLPASSEQCQKATHLASVMAESIEIDSSPHEQTDKPYSPEVILRVLGVPSLYGKCSWVRSVCLLQLSNLLFLLLQNLPCFDN